MKKCLILLIVGVLFLCSCGKNCADKGGEYRDGYSNGQIVSFSSENISCEKWIEKMNWNESKATNCWCEGFNDGKSGKENKYPEKK